MHKHQNKNNLKTIQHNKVKACLLLGLLNIMPIGLATAYAAENATKTQTKPSTAKTYNIPAGNLSEALPAYAAETGVLLGFDPKLTQGKETRGLRGNYSTQEGFKELLKGTDLEIVNDQRGGYYLEKATPAPSPKDKIPSLGESHKEFKLDKMLIRAKRSYEIGPLPGLGLTKDEIPGNVQSITAKEIKESHSLSITDLMNKKLQSVNVNDYQGNPFQMDVTYRGFTAGPQIGTPQGLSVFFDGIRVNEPFGDVVNWDMIPMNAIAGVDVFPGSNPIFGLNTLGGAFTLKTKDGFTNEGVNAEVLAGSYGRKQLQVEGGINNGTFALFGAGNFFLEDGWRDNSPSKVNQFFGKASYRGDKLDLSLSTLLVQTDLVGNGLLPTEMFAQDRSSVFTSPDTTKNKLQQFQLSGSYFVNDHFTVTGQVYRRSSKRHQIGADVYTDYDELDLVARKLNPGDPANGIPAEQFTCLYNSNNGLGIPDYYVVDLADPVDGYSTPFFQDYINNGFVPNYSGLTLNPDLSALGAPANFLPYVQQELRANQNYIAQVFYTPQGVPSPNSITAPPNPYSNVADAVEFAFNAVDGGFILQKSSDGVTQAIGETFFYTPDPNNPGQGIKHVVLIAPPVNANNCIGGITQPSRGPLVEDPVAAHKTPADGANDGSPGVVEGTPTAVITDNQIDQVTDGASIQFNWNFEHHKFMIGGSIDRPTAEYTNSQKLGLLDASRNAFLAPDQIREQYGAASVGVHNNDFSGESTTKSIYASETWSPIDTLHINGALRYNDTHVKNKVATRSFGFAVLDLIKFGSYPDSFNICPNGNCTGVPTGYHLPDLNNLLNPAETEKFSYYSLNPSFGATWQAKENLNIFANWAKGTRVPSVIELGCALDKTPVQNGTDANGNPVYVPKSIQENRQCSLPSTLSGDPYLPQIKATTYDVGMRGNFNGLLGTDALEWNLGAYQTDLKDDIYFVAVNGNGQGFFDSIGKTRRRGLEAGLSGKKDKWGFGINYGLTDATFENNFLMFSADNSSSKTVDGFGDGVIEVKKGSRMPGVPLHNLNANISYEITPKWQIGLTAVVHSESFVRGNENNEHKAGVVKTRQVIVTDPVTGVPSVVDVAYPPTAPGKVPGYATFNFQTSYKFNSEWTATMQINNLFDKEYFSAGRLGRNPFSANSTITPGAIGPDGYNHNSNNWLSTNFIAPSAPRGIWFSLNWQFDASKDKVSANSITPTEASEVQKPYQPLPPSLNRYQSAPKVEE